jgi:hypothetical protein
VHETLTDCGHHVGEPGPVPDQGSAVAVAGEDGGTHGSDEDRMRLQPARDVGADVDGEAGGAQEVDDRRLDALAFLAVVLCCGTSR